MVSVPHLDLMAVFMVPKVLRRWTTFMLAIAARRSPCGLQWQKYQQKNCEPTAHRKIVGATVTAVDSVDQAGRALMRSGSQCDVSHQVQHARIFTH